MQKITGFVRGLTATSTWLMAMADGAPGGSWGFPLLASKSTRVHGEMGKRERKRRGTRFEGSPAAGVLGMAGIRTAAGGVRHLGGGLFMDGPPGCFVGCRLQGTCGVGSS